MAVSGHLSPVPILRSGSRIFKSGSWLLAVHPRLQIDSQSICNAIDVVEKADDMHQFKNRRIVEPDLFQGIDLCPAHLGGSQGQLLGEGSDGALTIIQGFRARPDRFDEILAAGQRFEISQVRLDSVVTVIEIAGENRHPFSFRSREFRWSSHQTKIQFEKWFE